MLLRPQQGTADLADPQLLTITSSHRFGRRTRRVTADTRQRSDSSHTLADIRSVGVQGDGRTYGHPIVLRPVSSEYAMTADWTRVPYEVLERISTRITNEVPEVNRVVLDVTSKPPGTIEWE